MTLGSTLSRNLGFIILIAVCCVGVREAVALDNQSPHVETYINETKSTFAIGGAGLDVRFGPNLEGTARPNGEAQFDAIRSMVTNGPGRNAVGQVSALAGTVRGLVDNRLPGNNGYSVGVFGNATCEMDGCVSWGSNFSVIDAGPSKFIGMRRTIEGSEIDVNVFSTSTVAEGINIVLNTVGTTTVSPTFASIISKTYGSKPWAQGYSTGSGAAIAAFVAGQKDAEGRNVDSQPILFNTFDESGHTESVSLRATRTPQGPVLSQSAGAGISAKTFYEVLTTPASSSAPCVTGQFGDDANYHYVCVSTNRWKRVALSSF